MSSLPPLPRSRLAPLLVGLGAGVLLVGLVGSVRAADTDPVRVLVLTLGGVALHDGLLAPLVVTVAWLGARLLPARLARATGRAAFVSLCLVLVALPALTGAGERADNPSILPRDEWRGLLLALAVVWGVTLLLAVTPRPVRRRRGRRGGPGRVAGAGAERTTGIEPA